MKNEITEEDLAVFPPHLAHFLFVTLMIMIGHGFSSVILFYNYLNLHPGLIVAAAISTGMLTVVFNMQIVRGYTVGAKGLLVLSVIYTLIGATGVVDIFNQKVNFGLALITFVSSTLAFFTIRGSKYQKMANFMAKRWKFYRETGRTVAEELARKNKKKR